MLRGLSTDHITIIACRYSLLSVMSVLPSDGQAVALDRDSKSLAVAKKFVEEAGLSNLADFRTGAALETLEGVREEYGVHAFDIAFIGTQIFARTH